MTSHAAHMSYDIIFAGGKLTTIIILHGLILIVYAGGATACVTAGRLAAADPSLKILVSF